MIPCGIYIKGCYPLIMNNRETPNFVGIRSVSTLATSRPERWGLGLHAATSELLTRMWGVPPFGFHWPRRIRDLWA